MTQPGDDANSLFSSFDDLDSIDAIITDSKLQLSDHVVQTYQAFLSAMPEGAATLSGTGIVLHCNPRFMQMLGVPASEIIGMPFYEWLDGASKEQFQNLLADQQVMVTDIEIKRTGDGQIPAQLSCNRLVVDGMSLVCVVVVDLSDRRKLELERHKFVSLAENSIDFIAICGQHREFHYINPYGLNMIGVGSFAQASQIPFHEFFFPEDQDYILNVFCPQVVKEGNAESELRFRHFQTNEPIWVLINAFTIHDTQHQPMGFAAICRDITARKYIEDRLRLTSRVFDNSMESVVITNENRVIIEVNQAFTRVTGYEREDALGQNPRFLKSGEHSPNFYAEMWNSIDKYGFWSGEIWNKRKTGEKFIQWMSISAVRDDNDQVGYYVALATDITVYKLHQNQLEHIAHYDVLTDIPNRVLLTDRLAQAIAQAQRDNKLLAVCYLDLDGFKPINDLVGHDAGDQVLIKIAKRILQTIRSSDTVARIGGDEFVVLLTGLEKYEECTHSLNRLLENIAKPVTIQTLDFAQEFSVTASIGLTLYPQDEVDQDTLLRHADQAMYSAKQLGRNRYCFFDALQEQKLKSQYENLQRLQQGFAQREFILYYQPKLDLKTMQVIGVEALIRWQSPTLGLLAPGEFMHQIKIAELEIVLGEFVIAESLKQMDIWYKQGLNLIISINIAAKHLQAANFVKCLKTALQQYPALPYGVLEIEVLETDALDDISRVQNIILACKAIGISFALDDFGTGYSTMAYLRSLPADTLKIDQSFVREMLTDSGDLAIVQGIIALANAFRRKTVAEGVETAQHIKILKELGCDQVQGYAIAKPMPAEALVDWMDQWLLSHLIS